MYKHMFYLNDFFNSQNFISVAFSPQGFCNKIRVYASERLTSYYQVLEALLKRHELI